MMRGSPTQKIEREQTPSVEHMTDTSSPSALDPDIELHAPGSLSTDPHASKVSAFKSLGLLDRFLALWIFLTMLIGIILGNFVPNIGPALQRGKFVGVSVPIGKSICCPALILVLTINTLL